MGQKLAATDCYFIKSYPGKSTYPGFSDHTGSLKYGIGTSLLWERAETRISPHNRPLGSCSLPAPDHSYEVQYHFRSMDA